MKAGAVDPKRYCGNAARGQFELLNEVSPRGVRTRDDVIDFSPSISDQQLLDSGVQVYLRSKLRKQQGFRIMNSRHKFSARPGRTRIIGEVQKIVGSGTEMRDLLPEPPS